ncbi:hypothetical protein C2S52_000545 [Perilla frutescens var. hirtella]|nr:hypothetical protein C2S51_007869 [Perilla frutescens var. frutescens]KAH6800081.1 hypothetical protein C2S52_000545 [Perilla frutescens var. hirtella]
MEACFAAAKERCGGFAKQKCEPAFMNARIEASGLESKLVDWKDACRQKNEVSSLREKDLFGSDFVDIEEYLRKSS